MAPRGKVTVKDVAAAACVSPATVSMILRGTPNVSFTPETIARVLETAERMGYQRPAAQSGFERPTIAVFLPLITGTMFTFITQSITQHANEFGWDTVLLETHRDSERELRQIHSLKRMGVSGVIFTVAPLNPDAVSMMARALPTVIVGSTGDTATWDRVKNADSVLIDGFHIGELMANHLLELGHRRTAYVHINYGWQGYPTSQRLLGAQSCYDRYPDAKLTIHSRPSPDTLHPGSFLETRSLAREIAEECLEDPEITSFLCTSDYTALGVIDVLNKHGKRIPDDYSIASSDNLFASSLPGVSLTTVDRHPPEIGASAFDLLYKRITDQTGNPSHVTRVEYLCHLIVRNSTAAPRK